MVFDDAGRESTLHERVNRFKDKGYRGFKPVSGKSVMEGSVKVKAKNSEGLELIAEGDTLDEAYENMIERIDLALDS